MDDYAFERSSNVRGLRKAVDNLLGRRELHITLLSSGTRGDVHPYIALGLALKSAGHVVRVATQGNFRDFVIAQGLEYAPIRGNFQKLLESDEGQEMLSSGRGFRFIQLLLNALDTEYEAILDDTLSACSGTEAIIFNGSLFSGCHVAEAMQIPVFTSFFLPASPTASFPSPVLPVPKWLKTGPLLNKLSYTMLERPVWLKFMGRTNKWRRTLGLSPIPLSGGFKYYNDRQLPWMYCYSECLVPKAQDWPSWMKATGYWHLPVPADWQPPSALVRFLEAGPPPVFCGFGSMILRQPEERTRIVLDALRLSGQRALFYSGWGNLESKNLPENVAVVGDVPHEWLFPRAAAVCHHGGCGTTHAATRAGVPSVVLPFFADQPYWGRQVAALGIGPQPILQNKLTAVALAAAIQQAVEDQAMRSRAAEYGRQMRAENGTARAVEFFHSELDRPGKFLALHRTSH